MNSVTSTENESETEGSKYTPDDVIAGVLYYIGEDVPLRYDMNLLHETVQDLKEEFDMLDNFIFSNKRLSPVSPLLTSVLGRLQLARIIRVENPEYGQFELGRSATSYIEENIIEDKFGEDERGQLQEIAQEIENACGVE